MSASSQDDPQSRHKRGEAALERIHGDRGMGYVAQLREFCPDMADLLVAFPYGDVYSRPGLDARSRQIATIAALTALGGAEHELAIHIRSALRQGCTRQEVIEIILQMAVYAGFPRALSALAAARLAFEDAGSTA